MNNSTPHVLFQPIPANVLHEDCENFIFMSATELAAELQTMRAALPSARCAEALSDVDGFLLGDWVGRHGPAQPWPGEIDRMLELLSPTQTAQLRCRLEQIGRALDRFGGDQAFAVPPQWNRRWETLLAGKLSPACVGFVDLRRC